MKYFPTLILSLILLNSSCGGNNTQKQNGVSDIERTDEWSEKLMPHFLDMDRGQFSFTENTYNQIEELLELTLEVNKQEEAIKLSDELRDQFMEKIELLMNEMGELSHDSHSILMEYCHPLIELIDLCNNSRGEEELTSSLREIQVYLLNFEQLFPTN